jgi:hypothetical protein
MRCYNERPETTEHRSAQIKDVRADGRRRARPCLLRACAALCLTLFALQGITACGFAAAEKKPDKPAAKPAAKKPEAATAATAQPAPRADEFAPLPTPVIVEVKKPLKSPLKYRFPEGAPQAETEIVFKGTDSNFSFIYFDPLPEQVKLRVRAGSAGYPNSEPLQAKHWYPFLDKLSAVLESGPGARPPVGIVFWFGSPNRDEDRAQLTGMSPEAARSFAEGHEIKQDTERQLLQFFWDAQAAPGAAAATAALPTPAASAMPAASATPTPTPGTSLFAYMFEDEPLLGIAALVVGLAIIFFIIVFVIPPIIRAVRDRPRAPRKHSQDTVTTPAPAPTRTATGGDMYDSLGGDSGTQDEQETLPSAGASGAGDSGNSDYSSFRSKPITYRRGKKQDTQEKSGQQLRGDEPREPNPMPTQQASAATPAGGQDGRRLLELEDKVRRLEDGLGQKVGWQDKLSDAAREDVKGMLAIWEDNILRKSERRFTQHSESEHKPLDALVNEQTASVEARLKEMRQQVERAAEGTGGARRQFVEAALALTAAEARFRERIDGLKAVAERQTVLDSLYANNLGAVLGESVEALRDGNFHQQVVERLNQFFENGVGRGEGLPELRDRGEKINAALKDLLGRMEGLNQQAAGDARHHALRFDSVVAELAGLQSQLQTRRATVETTLRVPVSLHAGARQSFLDELGRGIRREVDKLSQPDLYFEGELERLITADLIAVVDICDKKIGLPPGSPAELEGALKRLFDAAGLRPILPRQGEPFKTAEQDLIEMAQSAGQSLTVERVITRGFYYKHRDSETLLRKAGVTVHR